MRTTLWWLASLAFAPLAMGQTWTLSKLLNKASEASPELAIALETWKEIKFEFDTVDKLDVQ